jgi:hypothetical protein
MGSAYNIICNARGENTSGVDQGEGRVNQSGHRHAQRVPSDAQIISEFTDVVLLEAVRRHGFPHSTSLSLCLPLE